MSKNKWVSLRAALIASACLAAISSTSAFAQAQPAGAESTDAGDIVVTAQRRSERLVDVPMAIVAVDADAVAKAGVVSVHDINKIAPGVQMNFAGCCTQPAIRGISTLTTGVGFENNVAIYVDGFYAPDNLSINGDFANLESVEVLKGPQGTLWGRNATGGAILLNTKRPSEVFTGKFEVGYARYDELTLSGYLSGPISDHVRFSISGYNRKSDGYYKQLDNTGKVIGNAAPIHQASARFKLEVDLGENTTATIGASYGLSSDPRGVIFTVLQYPGAFMPAPPARADQPFTATTNFPTKARAEVGEATLTLVHHADFGTITSYTGYAKRDTYLHYDFDATFLALVHAESDSDEKTFQQTIDVNVTSIEGLNLVVGGSYYHDHLDAPKGVSTGSFVAPSRADTQLRSEAWAGYVDGSLNITDRLVLSAGARYTSERKEADFTRYSNTTGAVLVGPFNVGKTFTAFTPRGSLRYEIDPRTNVYASISRGFRSGGYNPAGATSLSLFLPFDPETITAYELGFKTASRTLQLEASTFYYDFRNLQVGLTRNVPPFGLVNAVFNAPKAEVYGIDAMVTLRPVPDLNIRAGGAYLHARYKDFKDVSGVGLDSATGTNIVNQVQDWSGKEMARAPEFSGNLSIDYTVRYVLGGSVNLAGNIQYTSDYVTNNPSLYGPAAAPALQGKQRYRQSAYATANAQVSWTDESEHFRLTAYVNNLTDKLYRMSYNGNFTGDYATYAQPRTWGVRAGYEF